MGTQLRWQDSLRLVSCGTAAAARKTELGEFLHRDLGTGDIENTTSSADFFEFTKLRI